MYGNRLLTTLAAAVLLSVPALAQETMMAGANPNAPESNAWAMLSGPLVGKVVDAGGRPIGGARVLWVNLARDADGARREAARVAGEEKTRPDGTFAFKQPAKLAGTFASRLVVEVPGGIAAVAAKASNAKGNLIITVPPGRKLTVKITAPNGKPAAGIALKAYIAFPASRQAWLFPYQGGKTLKTDATGAVTLDTLPPATRLRIDVQNPQYRLDPPWNEFIVRRNADTVAPPVRLTATGVKG